MALLSVFAGMAGETAGRPSSGRASEGVGHNEFAGRVDEIVEPDHERDEQEVAALEDEPEAAAGLERLLLDAGLLGGAGHSLVPLLAGLADVPPVDQPGQDDAEAKDDPGDEHELELPVRPQDVPKLLHEGQGGHEAAERRAKGDEGEGPPADLIVVEVVGEAPELGDDEVVEDADPDEEQDAHGLDGHAAGVEGVEEDEVGDEESGRPGDEDMPGNPGGQPAEGLDDEDEQDRLGPAQIAFDWRGVLVDEEERLAQGLEDIVGEEEEEDVQGQEEGLGRLSLLDVGE